MISPVDAKVGYVPWNMVDQHQTTRVDWSCLATCRYGGLQRADEAVPEVAVWSSFKGGDHCPRHIARSEQIGGGNAVGAEPSAVPPKRVRARVRCTTPCRINEAELPVLDVRSLGNDLVQSTACSKSLGQQVEHQRTKPRVRDILGASRAYTGPGENATRGDRRR